MRLHRIETRYGYLEIWYEADEELPYRVYGWYANFEEFSADEDIEGSFSSIEEASNFLRGVRKNGAEFMHMEA